MSFSAFLVAALVASASARSVVLEQVPVLPSNWKQSDATVDANREIDFSIALKQPNVDIEALMAKSRGHISREDARALRAPAQSSVDSVMKWLKDENMTATQDHDLIRVTTTVAQAEKLLGAKFNQYIYNDEQAKLRSQEYSIPEELNDAISFIHPISNFMRPTRNSAQSTDSTVMTSSTTAAARPCADAVGIDCLKKLYNITYESPDENSPVRFGIAGYLEQNADHSDLKAFFKRQNATNLANYDFTVDSVNDGTNNTDLPGGLEAMLDLEYGMGIAYPAPVTYYLTGGRGAKLGNDGKPIKGKHDDNEPYLDFINYLLDKEDDAIPHVLSVSYGDDELSVPREYAKRVCDAYGLLTKRGTTILHSSGDGGSTGGQKSDCRSRDGKNLKTTMPTFPASCPWVTAVGGTKHDADEGIDFSSGGFSYYFDVPAYQRKATAGYIRSLNGHYSGYYNPKGRGIPDVSLVSNQFFEIYSGRRTFAEGTSASAPLFAALIALVNDARLRAGKASIGWINEILYSDKGVAAVMDITQGSSFACDFTTYGWPAKEGWDAITGLGETRDFSKLMDLLFAA